MKPPEVTVDDAGELQGWESFELWAIRNDPVIARIESMARAGRLISVDKWRLMIARQTAEKHRAFKTLADAIESGRIQPPQVKP